MISLNGDTDATRIYRETSGVKTVRMDGTGDTGSLFEIMRDAVIVIGSPTADASRPQLPQQPWGEVDAYSRG